MDNLTLENISYQSKIDDSIYARQIEDINITLDSLKVISDELKTKIGDHEAIFKDYQKDQDNILKEKSDFLENTVTDFTTSNIMVNKDGFVELYSVLNQDYDPADMNVQYLPSNYITKYGNDPTIVNFSQGTNTLFWISQIFVDFITNVEVTIELDYGLPVRFNVLSLNNISKYPVTLNNIEVYDEDLNDYVSVAGFVETTDRRINYSFTQAYTARKVRLTLLQELGEYIEKEILNDRRKIYDCSPTNLVRDELEPIINNNLINNNELNFDNSEEWANIHKYTLGVYNLKLSYRLYTKEDGLFISKPYKPIKENIDIVRIKTTQTTPGDSTITYKIQEHGKGTYVESDIVADKAYTCEKRWHTREPFNNITGNKILLKSSPVTDEGLYPTNVYVNGIDCKVVTAFNLPDNNAWKYQCIVRDNELYFNIRLETHYVLVDYYHYSNFIKIKAILSNNNTYNLTYTPRLDNIEVSFNDSALNEK